MTFARVTNRHVRKTSLVKFHLIPTLFTIWVPSSYWTMTLLETLYQVSVHWGRCLPLTSFWFRIATDTLASLAIRFPLLRLVSDLHPLDNTHASQTQKFRSDIETDLSLPRKRQSRLSPSCSLTNRELYCMTQITWHTLLIFHYMLKYSPNMKLPWTKLTLAPILELNYI